jgi:hypothetical protein
MCDVCNSTNLGNSPKEDFTIGVIVDHLFQYLLQLLNMDRSHVLAIHTGDDNTDDHASMVRILGESYNYSNRRFLA